MPGCVANVMPALAACLCAVVVLTACKPDAGDEQTPSKSRLELSERATLTIDMLVQINEARTNSRYCGEAFMPPAPPVAWDERVALVAERYTEVMAEQDWFGHIGPDGSTPGDRLRQAGYQPRVWGENIAAGQQSVPAVISSWLGSPDHCLNIMNHRFTEIGAGLTHAPEESDPRRYWALMLTDPEE